MGYKKLASKTDAGKSERDDHTKNMQRGKGARVYTLPSEHFGGNRK
jgi:hypothetical protein